MFPFIFLGRIKSVHEQTDVSKVVHRAKEDEQAAGDAPAKVHKVMAVRFDLATPVGTSNAPSEIKLHI
jgi:hypothetical protein